MLDFFADIISKNMYYIQLWQRRAPRPVTTGVRLPYFTDGKSNSYYHVMTEATFTLSPTRSIKTRMPVSATCPTETIITCREGKSHSPLYAAHSIIEVSKLSSTPCWNELKSSLYFSFHQNKSRKSNLFQDKYSIHFKRPEFSAKYLICYFISSFF